MRMARNPVIYALEAVNFLKTLSATLRCITLKTNCKLIASVATCVYARNKSSIVLVIIDVFYIKITHLHL